MKAGRLIVLIAAVALIRSTPASVAPPSPRTFYVSPAGNPANDGSSRHPLDLATALSQSSPARPGDTIWVHGGTYYGSFDSALRGDPSAPIVVRNQPGERAILDSSSATNRDSQALRVSGSYTWFWGLEFTDSSPRVPDGLRPHGAYLPGTNNKLINCVAHDAGIGFGNYWDGVGNEIYGSISYFNGDRLRHHGAYLSNLTSSPIKYFRDNILFGNYGFGIQVYAESEGKLGGLRLEGNVSFNTGAIAKVPARSDILVGGNRITAERIAVVDNFTYQTTTAYPGVQLGYDRRVTDADLTATGNYIAGGNPALLVQAWQSATITGNTVYGEDLLASLFPAGPNAAKHAWNNSYVRGGTRPFRFDVLTALTFAEWKRATGYDGRGALDPSSAGVKVFVRPNAYERGRAHVVVYNWSRQPQVEVDLAAAGLAPGGRYEVRDVQDYFGQPVASGTYDGKPVNLPLNHSSIARPIQPVEVTPAHTGPEFAVFVVVPAKPAGSR
jgi:hypothetical protein